MNVCMYIFINMHISMYYKFAVSVDYKPHSYVKPAQKQNKYAFAKFI